MKMPDSLLPHLYLKPGEMTILEKPALISTILGSCVAVVLYSERLGLAALGHALMPHCKRRAYVSNVNDLLAGDCVHCPDAFKYVDCSVSMMAEAFLRFGATPGETRTHIYGGAQMFTGHSETSAASSVGLQNAAVARKVVADHGLKLTLVDVGGRTGRKIQFNTQTGEVIVHKAGARDLSQAEAQWPKGCGV